MAHIDAGKTTTTERILYYTGVSHKMGEVHEGTATDGLDGAGAGARHHHHLRRRPPASGATTASTSSTRPGTSTSPSRSSAACACSTARSRCSARVGGVEPQSETVWRQADKYRVPRIAFINKWTASAPTPTAACAQIRERLKAHPVVDPDPDRRSRTSFTGVVDLIEMKLVDWDDDDASAPTFASSEIPGRAARRPPTRRAPTMIEAIAEVDDEVMRAYLEEQALVARARCARRCAGRPSPGRRCRCCCGAAFKNKGVQPLLDAVVDYLPSPLDIPPVTRHGPRRATTIARRPRDDEPFSALAFKIMNDPFVGHADLLPGLLGQARGRARPSTTRPRASASASGACCSMHANKREDIKEVTCGNIAAAVGLRVTTTGDTLCDEKHAGRARADGVPGAGHLDRHRAEDAGRPGQAGAGAAEAGRRGSVVPRPAPTPRPGRRIISGMGELHLEIIVDRLVREFKVEANVGKPAGRLPRDHHRRRPRPRASTSGRPAATASTATSCCASSPAERARASSSRTRSSAASIPREFVPAVERGVRESLARGVLAGYPLVDVEVTLTDGSYHEVDSSEMAFEIAGSMARPGGGARGRRRCCSSRSWRSRW